MIKALIATGYNFCKACIGLPKAWQQLGAELEKANEMEGIFLNQTGRILKRVQNLGVKYNTLSTEAMMVRKKSDTLIVLGSGASINDISDSQWEFIGKHDSIGFNFWLIHHFIPTFHHAEYLRNRKGLVNYIAIMKEVGKRYLDVPFLLSTNIAHTGWHPKYRPEVFPQNVKLYVYPHGRAKAIPSDRPIESADFSDVATNLGEAPYLGRGSLVAVVHIGFQMKYKKVIMAGVDLNNTHYFYDGRDCMAWKDNAGTRGYGYHATTVWRKGEYHAVDTFLPAFNEFVLKPHGTELFIASKSSLLYPSLPYHPLSDEVVS